MKLLMGLFLLTSVYVKAQFQISYTIPNVVKTNSTAISQEPDFYTNFYTPWVVSSNFYQIQMTYQFKLKKESYFSVGLNYAQNKVLTSNLKAFSFFPTGNNISKFSKMQSIGGYAGWGVNTIFYKKIRVYAEQGLSIQVPTRKTTILDFFAETITSGTNTIYNEYLIKQNTKPRLISLSQIGIGYNISNALELQIGINIMLDINKSNSQEVYVQEKFNNIIINYKTANTPLFRESIWGTTFGIQYNF